MAHLRIVPTFSNQKLPIYLESMGYHPDQEKIVRPSGYPFYHWIQTAEGKGIIGFEGKRITIPANSGVLLTPDVPHTYEALTEQWGTLYLTFGGHLADQVLSSLDLNRSMYFQWEKNTPFAALLMGQIQKANLGSDIFGLNASAAIYYFLMMLQKYGRLQENTAVSRNLEKLHPLISWMEAHVSQPDISLDQMADRLGVSARHLTVLFRKTFDLPPYAYFLQLRIRKAKTLLMEHQQVSVKEVAEKVGFRSVSHFVATFRKIVGISPKKFRELH